ncbi:MAG: fused MFS/spermidine synthase [Nitrospirae bacterium]|nr:fused MFS/spermidine synthase [Nitrospirota bacterium]
MQIIILSLIYLLFFLSGAAALMYEVVWVRYLSLIFGGSHLAVTTVLSVFMGGLAFGSYTIGKYAGRYTRLLRLYGFLELGIAASALVFLALIRFYPSLYVPLARIADTSPVYLSFIRFTLAAIAMIVPTTLMGGTLPVLSSFTTGHMKGPGRRLSFLYGFNTLGAVVGAASAGFFLLRYYSVSTTITAALLLNVLIGILSIALQNKAQVVLDEADRGDENLTDAALSGDTKEPCVSAFSLKLVLWGIGVSGFCALGYEVLWTRILSIIIGASTYGFTLLLMAFLTGIGLGSAAYGLMIKRSGMRPDGTTGYGLNSVIGFGLTQVMIGIAALLVTLHIRDLPTYSAFLYDAVHNLKSNLDPFKTSQLVNFVLAFSFLFVPAFFMGIAFPLAGAIHSRHKKQVGSVVGEILSYNTIGAILGSAVSGFVLIYLLGLQLSLQLIILINIGYGLLVMVSIKGKKSLNWATAGAVAAVILFLLLNPGMWRLWDIKYYALYQSNHREMYSTPEKAREIMNTANIIYYGEGAQAIVSSIQSGEFLSFITNGRVEASNSNEGMQCQYTLGHLPMLLNKNPKKVFVLGTGSGMTLGATSVHPSVEQITLAEIEPKVLGVARTFGIYNHYVLDNPKLRIVFNDGRNFLMTTKEKFDVITADPIHPWFSGTGYLYSTEYFKLAAEHLNPGGIVCQWLPLYELSDENLKSIVATLRQNFPYIMVWLTHDDVELIGSNAPIIIDEKDLERRIREPQVLQDLARVKMGSAEAFLSYFLMGTEGARAYSSGGVINTDDNLYLEFSAPQSIGKGYLMWTNTYDLIKYRESILPYLLSPVDEIGRARQIERWEKNSRAAILDDRAHVLMLAGRTDAPEYAKLTAELDAQYPAYAPWRFLKNETSEESGGTPKLLKQIELTLINEKEIVKIRFSAVLLQNSPESARVFFVDQNTRTVFGKLKVHGANKEAYITDFVDDVLKSVQALYYEEQNKAVASGKKYPSTTSLLPKIKGLVEMKVDQEAR